MSTSPNNDILERIRHNNFLDLLFTGGASNQGGAHDPLDSYFAPSQAAALRGRGLKFKNGQLVGPNGEPAAILGADGYPVLGSDTGRAFDAWGRPFKWFGDMRFVTNEHGTPGLSDDDGSFVRVKQFENSPETDGWLPVNAQGQPVRYVEGHGWRNVHRFGDGWHTTDQWGNRMLYDASGRTTRMLEVGGAGSGQWRTVDQHGNPGFWDNAGNWVYEAQIKGEWTPIDAQGNPLAPSQAWGMQRYSAALDREQRQNAQRIQGEWDAAGQKLLKLAETTGERQREDIHQSYDQLAKTLRSQLVGAGMSGTSAMPQTTNRVFRAEQKDIEDLNKLINETVLSAQGQMDVSKIASLQSLFDSIRNFSLTAGTGLYDRANAATLNDWQTRALLEGNWLGALEGNAAQQRNFWTHGVQDLYPQPNYDLMASFGAYSPSRFAANTASRGSGVRRGAATALVPWSMYTANMLMPN